MPRQTSTWVSVMCCKYKCISMLKLKHSTDRSSGWYHHDTADAGTWGWRLGWGRGGWRCLETDRRVLIKTPGIFNYTHWLASNQGNTDTLTHRNIEKKPFKKYIINRFTDPRVGDCKIFICDFCPCHLTSWIWVEQDTRYIELDDGGEPSSDSANLKIWNWNIRQILVEITAI